MGDKVGVKKFLPWIFLKNTGGGGKSEHQA